MTIHIKIDTETKVEAKKVAEEFGFTLTSLVNALLKQITRTKQLYLSTEREEPTDYFKQLMREADEDVKAGRVLSFKRGEDALSFFRQIRKKKVENLNK